ncbi:MAG: hypothetical protein ACJAUZ_003008 [Flavobacteriaceae bacterium]
MRHLNKLNLMHLEIKVQRNIWQDSRHSVRVHVRMLFFIQRDYRYGFSNEAYGSCRMKA